jgi:hypothetical protein
MNQKSTTDLTVHILDGVKSHKWNLLTLYSHKLRRRRDIALGRIVKSLYVYRPVRVRPHAKQTSRSMNALLLHRFDLVLYFHIEVQLAEVLLV